MIINSSVDMEEKCWLTKMTNILKESLSDDYVLTVNPLTPEWPDREPNNIEGKFNILLGLWDEYSTNYHRNLLDRFDLIFNQYVSGEEEAQYSNVFSLPLGYNCAAVSDQEHIQKIKPIKERSIDAFFSGHMSSQKRYDSMIENINYLKDNKKRKLFNFDFNVTSGFMRGLSGPEYYEKMYNSKIAFCPPGNVSNETFRFYEALMCGCVVVCPKMPETEIYRNLPVVQVENFNKQGAITVLELLEDQDRLEKLQAQNIDFWNNNYTPEKIASYILSKIN